MSAKKEKPQSKPTEDLFEKYFGKSQLEFKKQRIYTELNAEIIATIPDKNLEQAIQDFTAEAIDKDWENDVRKVPALGAGFSAVYFLGTLDYEVNNGGFNQFFFNEGREAVVLAKEGADLMGLRKLSAVISKALVIEQIEREKMAKVKKVGTIEAFFESYDEISFEEADEAFEKLDIDLGKEILSFIRRKPEFFEGKVEK